MSSIVWANHSLKLDHTTNMQEACRQPKKKKKHEERLWPSSIFEAKRVLDSSIPHGLPKKKKQKKIVHTSR